MNLWNAPDPNMRLLTNALLLFFGALALPYVLRWCWKHTWEVLGFVVGWGVVACFVDALR